MITGTIARLFILIFQSQDCSRLFTSGHHWILHLGSFLVGTTDLVFDYN